MEIIEAWSVWLGGELPRDMDIYGISIVWWGRIGLVSQYLGALTIIIEIIGAAHIRSFSSKIKEQYGITKTVHSIWNTMKWVFVLLSNASGSQTDPNDKENISAEVISGIIALFSMGLGLYIVVTNWGEVSWYFLIFFGIVVTMMTSTMIALCISVVIVITVMFLVFMNIFILQPVVYILETPFLDKIAKIFSILLISVGFHFSLLTT
jgi:hypothetical protein